MTSFEKADLARACGGPAVKVGPGLELFPDGTSLNSGGVRRPPTDPRLRKQAQRRYHREFLRWAEGDYRQLDVFLRGEGPAPVRWAAEMYELDKPRNAEEALAHLRLVIDRERAAVVALDAEIGSTMYV